MGWSVTGLQLMWVSMAEHRTTVTSVSSVRWY